MAEREQARGFQAAKVLIIYVLLKNKNNKIEKNPVILCIYQSTSQPGRDLFLIVPNYSPEIFIVPSNNLEGTKKGADS